MLFKRKMDRLIDVEKTEKEFKDTEKEPLEKGDLPAIIIAAILVLVPVALILIGIFYGFSLLFLR